jgi:hypothetical protein
LVCPAGPLPGAAGDCYDIAYHYDGDRNFLGTEGAGTLNVTYDIRLLSPLHAKKSGSTLPIQIDLASATGADVSSANIAVTALGIARISAPEALLPASAAGNSRPDNQFKYGNGKYQYDLKLPKGLVPGKYLFYFAVFEDPVVHSFEFEVTG